MPGPLLNVPLHKMSQTAEFWLEMSYRYAVLSGQSNDSWWWRFYPRHNQL